MAIAQNKIHPPQTRILVHRPAYRRHGMAVDQQGQTEAVCGRIKEAAERPMIGPVKAVDAGQSLVGGNLAVVDFRAIAHDPGDRAETGSDPR